MHAKIYIKINTKMNIEIDTKINIKNANINFRKHCILAEQNT